MQTVLFSPTFEVSSKCLSPYISVYSAVLQCFLQSIPLAVVRRSNVQKIENNLFIFLTLSALRPVQPRKTAQSRYLLHFGSLCRKKKKKVRGGRYYSNCNVK